MASFHFAQIASQVRKCSNVIREISTAGCNVVKVSLLRRWGRELSTKEREILKLLRRSKGIEDPNPLTLASVLRYRKRALV